MEVDKLNQLPARAKTAKEMCDEGQVEWQTEAQTDGKWQLTFGLHEDKIKPVETWQRGDCCPSKGVSLDSRTNNCGSAQKQASTARSSDFLSELKDLGFRWNFLCFKSQQVIQVKGNNAVTSLWWPKKNRTVITILISSLWPRLWSFLSDCVSPWNRNLRQLLFCQKTLLCNWGKKNPNELHSTGNYTQYFVTAYKGKESEKLYTWS